MANNANRSGGKNDLVYWIAAVAFIVTGIAAPIGFLMIVLKLLGGSKRGTARGRHPYYTQREGQDPVGARTSGPQQEQGNAAQGQGGGRSGTSPAQARVIQLSAKGKKLITVGGILSAIFGFCSVVMASGNLWMLPDVAWFLEETLPILCFFFGGLGCLWAGLRKRKQASRYRGYLAMIGHNKSMTVSALAAATGRSPGKVRDDLEDMLEDGMFPAGFLDYGGDRLVLSGDGLSDQPAGEKKKAKSGRKDQEEDAILAEIRAVNDAIDNEKLSAQIDRIGVITAKILDYQRQHPDKSPQLHSFLSYYLPTTLKILRAYSQLEDQEVSGENITSAMERIEGMMDKVVEGFEKQLDQLFQGDAMDITADVEVLERMLAKDGLSDHQGLTLGL